jgi:hypothetical protein
MSGPEEETYTTMFSSLRHPARRKILKMLSDSPMTFSQLLDELKIPSSHLTYHLENLGELVVKNGDGKYRLSNAGESSVAIIKGAEDVPDHQTSFGSLPIKWKTVMAAFLIGIILFAGAFYVQYSSYNQLSANYGKLKVSLDNVQSQYNKLLSWSSSNDKAISVMQSVAQIDLTKYQTTLLSDTHQVQADCGGVVEEVLKYSLVSSGGSLDIDLRFRDNHLSLYQLSIVEGVPNFALSYTQRPPTDSLEATKGIISRYASVSNDSYLSEMAMLLSSANKSTTESSLGNTKLKILTIGDSSQISLMYSANGGDFAAKSVRLMFRNGVLEELVDDWFLYRIDNTEINVSGPEAIQTARNAAKTFSWNASGTKVTTFNILDEPVSAIFFPHPRTDPLFLVPYWYITLYLDKEYPGGVNSIAVGIWADTGQVANIEALSGQSTA